ncbi:MAG: hypothetical protein LBS88_12835 [Tannerellaceae bacterium]|nr:hypothetical protein [Tannerellaceae bacterium]
MVIDANRLGGGEADPAVVFVADEAVRWQDIVLYRIHLERGAKRDLLRLVRRQVQHAVVESRKGRHLHRYDRRVVASRNHEIHRTVKLTV